VTDEQILLIGRRALDKCHGTDAQHLYIAREVERHIGSYAKELEDEPCTQEDRDRIRAAAFDRAELMRRLIDDLELAGRAKLNYSSYARSLFLEAAAQLRQLAEGK